MEKVIVLPELLEESIAAAMTEFAETAIQEAVYSTIKDTGYITESEMNMIRNFALKVVTEAADEFAPLPEEVAELVKQLENAGYKVVLEPAEAKNLETSKPEAGKPEAGNIVAESASLADKIAAKLNLL